MLTKTEEAQVDKAIARWVEAEDEQGRPCTFDATQVMGLRTTPPYEHSSKRPGELWVIVDLVGGSTTLLRSTEAEASALMDRIRRAWAVATVTGRGE